MTTAGIPGGDRDRAHRRRVARRGVVPRQRGRHRNAERHATAGAGGAYALIFTINNGVGGDVVQNFTLNVNQPPAITSANATTFTVGSAGSFTVTMTGFPAPTVSVTAGTLPSGVTLSPAGLLSGTPAPGTGGVHNVTLTATNGVGANAVQAFTLTVNEAPAITSANTATFVLNTAGTTFQVVMTGFPAPTVSVTAGVLPTGLTLSSAGLLSGTPTQSGSFPVTLTAINGTLPNATQAFTVLVNAPPAITSAASDTFVVGTADTFTVTTTGFPAPTLSQTGTLPTGVTFTPATRVLAGTATQTGAFPLVFTAANGVGTDAVQNFTLNVVCPAIAVTPTSLADGLYLVAYGAVDFNQTGSTGSGFTWGATGLPAGLTIDATTGVVSGTPTNTSLSGVVVVTVTDNFGCQGVLNTAITVRPTTDNESYTGGVGNTQYVVSGAVPTTPHVFVADNVKIGDNGPGALSVVFGPAVNGTVSEGSTDGTFTYTPNVNFGGPTDSFTYTLTDGNGVTNTGTVTITLSGLVWYVNNSGGNGDGRSHAPFNTLANAAAPSAGGSVIYVHTGTGATTGNLAMDVSQSVFGAGGTFAVNNLLIPAGTKPTLSGTVTAANSAVVRHVNFSGAAPAITATATTGLSVIDVDISGGAVGILLNAVSGTIDFDDVDFNVSVPGTTALSMTNVNGALDIDSNSSFASGSAAELLVSGGTGAITIAAPFANSSGQSINIQARTGATPSTVIFAAPITDTGTGIFLDNNDTTTFIFRGGVSLSTGANAAFTATNGGTVNVCALDGCASGAPLVNTLTTTTGIALNVANTTIGASGLTFRSIAANGAVNGIVLSNTGASGRFTISGNGGACSTAGNCTGGAIQNTTGEGILLTNTRNVSLTRMFIANTGFHGVSGTGMTDITAGAQPTFEIRNSILESPGDADNESALYFDTLGVTNITGRLVVADTTIQNFEDVGIHVGNVSGTLTIDVTNVLITNNSDTNGEEGIDVAADGTANITLNVTGTRTGNTSTTMFTDLEGGGINAIVQNSGVLDLNLTGLVDRGTGGPDNFPTPPAFTFSAEGSASTLTFDITNNAIVDASGDGIFIGHEGSIMGRITDNVISGIATGDGIRIDTDTTSATTSTILIQNNNIGNDATFPGIGDDGIQVLHRDGTKTLNLTIDNNQIRNTNSEGIRYFADDDVLGGGPGNAVRISNNQFGSNGLVDLSDSIVIIAQDPGTDVCTSIAANTSVEGITLQQSLSAVLQITQASTAALGAANGGAAVTPTGTITFNGACTSPPLPINP